ncbi:MAG: hypothetical protein ABIH91_02100, partial [Candidatus Omnitrophota bacterium]
PLFQMNRLKKSNLTASKRKNGKSLSGTKVDTFAFISHPESISQVKNHWPLMKLVPRCCVKPFLKVLPPFKVSKITNLRSLKGEELRGYFIFLPVLPLDINELSEEAVMGKIISAGHIFQKLGVKIIGLGGYFSVFSDKGSFAADELKIALTSGNCLTAWSVYEAVYRMARVKKRQLKDSTLAIIGAATPIGMLCAKKFLPEAAKIAINDGDHRKLEDLRSILLKMRPEAQIIVEDKSSDAVKDADIVIIAVATAGALFNWGELKSGSIACDVSLPRSFPQAAAKRSDISLITGGLIKLPHCVNLGINMGLPENIIYADLAETLLLALEEKFSNYSLGDNINVDKLEEIANIAVRHGFEVWVPDAPLL